MADTISKAKQAELCRYLNEHFALPGITWRPDISAIPGGIVAHDASGQWLWEARRDAGRVAVRPNPGGLTLLGYRHAFEGRNWTAGFARVLFGHIRDRMDPVVEVVVIEARA